MSQKANDMRDKGIDVLNLRLGEPDFDTPDHIKQAAKDALDAGYTKYTPVHGLPELKKAIQSKFKKDNDLHFNLDQIVVSNGAKQTIANLFISMIDPGDEVVLLAPYWVSYSAIAEMNGAKITVLDSTVENDFKSSPEELRDALTDRTKILLFSSPCNPSGSVYSRRELEDFARVLEDFPQVHIIADEIYEYINFSERHASIGSIESVRDRTITVNGFSKGFAMTGWRLGYMGGPRHIAKACTKIQGQFTSGATSFGQKAASVALMADQGPTLKMKEAFYSRRNLMIDLLSQVHGFEVNKPEGAFYIFPDISSYFGRKAPNGSIIP
jgi:aspartate aminotransferase